MQNISDQLQIFSTQELNDLTLSHSDRLVRISALLEREKGWEAIEVPLSAMHFPQYLTSNQMFLSGKTLKALFPQMVDEISSQFYKPLPTLGFMSANGNLLIHRGYYPKIESGYTLSDILQPLSEIGKEYFLSKKTISRIISYKDNQQLSIPSRQGKTQMGVGSSFIIESKYPQENSFIIQRGHGYVGDSVNGICPTIRRNSFEHNTSVNGIRRLTEIECERLQGFPDNWTQYGNYGELVKPIPKTQRYKLCGNAVTAKMVELIGDRIINHLE